MWFKNTKILKIAGNMISGPLVDKVISLVHMMYGKPSPFGLIDNVGWNKIHYNHPVLQTLNGMAPGSQVDIGQINIAISCLANYPKQISNIQQIKKEFEQELLKQQPQQQQTQVKPQQEITPEGKLKVYIVKKNQYGNYIVKAPESDERISPQLFNKHGNAKAVELGLELETKKDNYGNTYKAFKDLWKNWTRGSKSFKDPQPQSFIVSKQFLSTVSKMLQEYNQVGAASSKKKGIEFRQYDTSDIDAEAQKVESELVSVPEKLPEKLPGTETTQETPKQPQKYPVEITIHEATAKGYVFLLKFPIPKEFKSDWHYLLDPFKTFMKQQLGTSLAQHMTSSGFGGWIVSKLSVDKLPELAQWFEKTPYYDTSEIHQLYEKLKSAPQETEKKETKLFPLTFINVSHSKKYQIAIAYDLKTFQFRQDKLEEFKQIIEFTFPTDASMAADGVGDRYFDSKGQIAGRPAYCVKGTFNDFSELKMLLLVKHFDPSGLRNIIRALVINKQMDITRLEGVADGYEVKTPDGKLVIDPKTGFPEEDLGKFYSELQQYKLYKNGEIHSLMPKQMESVKWLYSRNSALNGSKTGVGKCLKGDSRVVVNDIVTTMEELWEKYAKRTVEINENEEYSETDEDLFIHSVDNNKIVKGRIEGLFRQKFTGKLRKITTDNKSVTCTFQHKFLNHKQEWTNVLNKGDIICSSPDLKEIYHEKIIDIEEIDFDGYIYDLTIEKYHNFIAEGLCCHNTAVAIVAADMRTKKTDGRVLIFTVKNVQDQFIKEIQSLIPDASISTDPAAGAKWTVLYYNQIDASLEPVSEEDQEEQKILTDSLSVQFPAFSQVFKQFGNLPAKQFVKYVETMYPDIGESPNFEDWARTAIKIEKKTEGAQQALEFINTITQQNFEVLILDESHAVKNDSNTSENIMKISQNIPFKWGASATVSANKPIDVYRQLKAVGHRLGNISEKMFKREFTGLKTKTFINKKHVEIKVDFDPSNVNAFFKAIDKNAKKGKWGPKIKSSADLTEDQIMKIAEEILKPAVYSQMIDVMKLNTWLILTDVYKSLTKEEINPDMPEHIISSYDVVPTPDQAKKLEASVMEDMQKYKDPALEVSKMMAYRKRIALVKAPTSCRLAREIVKIGKKVLIFTCFKETAKVLEATMNALIAPYKATCQQIMGGEDSEIRLDKLEKFKDPMSPVKCLVLGVLSGGTGIDLPNVVEHVIMNDFDWTPKSAEQSEGRAFRINSKSDVRTLYMLLKESIKSDEPVEPGKLHAITPDAIYYRTVEKKRHSAEKVQNIDNEHAQLILQNKPVNHLLEAAQEEHWNIVKSQVVEKLEMNKWRASINLKTAFVSHKNWLKKISQKKPMPLPFSSEGLLGGKGLEEMDFSMSRETADFEKQRHPDINFWAAGNKGLVADIGDKVVKYTFSQKELETAKKIMYARQDGDPIECVAQVYDIEEIQHHPEYIGKIVFEKVTPLIIPKAKNQFEYVTDDEIKAMYTENEYEELLDCLESNNISYYDSHTANLGRNSQGKLVLLDIG